MNMPSVGRHYYGNDNVSLSPRHKSRLEVKATLVPVL